MRYRSNILVIIVLFLTFIITLNCSENKPSDTGSALKGKTRVIKDMKGNTLTIPEKLDRVALFGGPTGQLAYILGKQDSLCAVTKTLRTSALVGIFDPRMKKVPGPRTLNGCINIEELIQADPQLVIAGDIDGQIVQKKTSIPVAFFEDNMDVGRDEVKRDIRFYGYILKAEKRAEKYCNYLDKNIAFIKSRVKSIPDSKKKLVFNGYNPNHLVTLGGDTFLQERIETAGCKNASIAIRTSGKKEGLHSGLDEVSMEQVLGWNPDIIIINYGKPEDIYKDQRWRNIKAVKNRQVYTQPVGVFIWNRPTAESAVLYPLWLATIAYPERFKDISLSEEVRRFYAEIFDFKMSPVQIKKLLSGEYKTAVMSGIH